MTTTMTSPTTGRMAPAPTIGAKSTTAKAAPNWRKLAWLPAIVVVGGLGAWALLSMNSTREVDGGAADRFTVSQRTFNVVLKEKGELQAAHSTDIKCEVEGRSTIISLIPEGTAVKQGDLLVELASDEIEDRIRQEELKEANAITAYEAAKKELEIQRDKNASDIRKANLEIDLNRLELEKYQKGDWLQRLKDADIAIEQAQMTLERRKQDYEDYRQLYEKKYTTKTEFEEAEFNFKKAEWDLEKAHMAKEVLKTYTHVADLTERQSDLEEAIKEADRVKKNAEAEEIKKLRSEEGKGKELQLIQDQLAKLRHQKEKCRIYAPGPGFVVYYSGGGGRWYMNNENQIKEGAQVFERQILMQLPDTAVMNAVVRVHEAKTDKLALGQQATVTVEGVPDQQFTGTVTKIAVLADTQSQWLNPDLKEYETQITLDPSDVPLKPGVTAHAEIHVETVSDRLAVPVQAVYSKGGRKYVFRDRGRHVNYVEVTLGSVGSQWAEIVSGVEGGDTVLLAFGDELKRTIPEAGPGERRGIPTQQALSDPNGPAPKGLPGERRGPRRSDAQGESAANDRGLKPSDSQDAAAKAKTPASNETDRAATPKTSAISSSSR